MAGRKSCISCNDGINWREKEANDRMSRAEPSHIDGCYACLPYDNIATFESMVTCQTNWRWTRKKNASKNKKRKNEIQICRSLDIEIDKCNFENAELHRWKVAFSIFNRININRMRIGFGKWYSRTILQVWKDKHAAGRFTSLCWYRNPTYFNTNTTNNEHKSVVAPLVIVWMGPAACSFGDT